MSVLKIRVEGSYTHELIIPESWRFSPLNNVIEIVGGSQPPKTFFSSVPSEGFIRLIQIRDYKSDKNIVYIPKEKARRFVTKDDVMIGRYGPPIFQILRGLEGAYNVALMKAVPILGGINNGFLFHYLNNRNIFNYVESASDRTAGQSGVNKAHLEKYPVGVPPLAEQEKIASQLDSLLAKVDSIKSRLDAIPDIIKRFRQSVLSNAISGKLTEEWRSKRNINDNITKNNCPSSWVVTTLGKAVNYGKCEKILPHEIGDDTWGIELEDIEKETSKLIKKITFGERKTKSTKNSFQKGNVLYSKLRPYLDKVLIANDEGVCSTEIIPITPTKDVMAEYLFFWLKSPLFITYVNDITYGVNMPRLGTTDGKNAPINIPPVEEQEELISKVQQYLLFADKAEQKVNAAQERVNNLTQSILAKAFRGELTTEWRELNQALITGENSAEFLLAKIKTEREALSKKPSAKTKTPKKKVAKKTTAGKAQT